MVYSTRFPRGRPDLAFLYAVWEARSSNKKRWSKHMCMMVGSLKNFDLTQIWPSWNKMFHQIWNAIAVTLCCLRQHMRIPWIVKKATMETYSTTQLMSWGVPKSTIKTLTLINESFMVNWAIMNTMHRSIQGLGLYVNAKNQTKRYISYNCKGIQRNKTEPNQQQIFPRTSREKLEWKGLQGQKEQV